MTFKPIERLVLVIVLVLAGCALITGAWLMSSSLLTTAGLLFDIAGIMQLDVSGVFEEIFEKYGDEEKYPYGPPSAVTREMMDDLRKRAIGAYSGGGSAGTS